MMHSGSTQNKEEAAEAKALKKADKFFAKAEKAYGIGDTKNGQKYEKKATDYRTAAKTHHENILKDQQALQKVALERQKIANHVYTPPQEKKAAAKGGAKGKGASGAAGADKSANKAEDHADKAQDKGQQAQQKADEGKPAQADAKAASADKEADKAQAHGQAASNNGGPGQQAQAQNADQKADQARGNADQARDKADQQRSGTDQIQGQPQSQDQALNHAQASNQGPAQNQAQYQNQNTTASLNNSGSQVQQQAFQTPAQAQNINVAGYQSVDPNLASAQFGAGVTPLGTSLDNSALVDPFIQYHNQTAPQGLNGSSYQLGSTYTVDPTKLQPEATTSQAF